ncbi:MAG: ribose 5-phosphate isomerase B [Oscillospiraceae bacterium]|jgi:ribose 5-phosphate isomerase B|nr:ribose 5-phosphate isomerase B [Oscillospiraceae bacterium]
MTVAIGCDHGGYDLKMKLIAHFNENNTEYVDLGTHSTDSVNYAPIAKDVCDCVVGGKADFGILVCSTGIGMSIAANKVAGIRAACCSDYFSAKYTRLHNNANVLCLGGRVVGDGLAFEMVDVFLLSEFEGGRHQTRIDQIADIENERLAKG